ncbi:hypothetical protein KDM41_13515 [bacterium]|nr:hypothetical protein [bacterium]
MKAGRGKDDPGARPSRPATTRVTEPRLTVVEGTELADPAALDEALGLLVTWAIRAHREDCRAMDDSVNCDIDRACEGSN